MRISLVLVVVLAAVLAVLSTDACRSKPPVCEVCNRQIHRGMQSRLSLDGHMKTTCCVACSLHFQFANHDAVIKSVTDYSTGTDIDSASATYLFNSQIDTCAGETNAVRTKDSAAYVCFDRCRPSVIAFRNQADALKVQKGYGGKVVNFTELHQLFEKLHTPGGGH